MEGNKKGVISRFKLIYTLTRHGLFLHGVRNNLAKIGIDIMPYYWFKGTKELFKPQTIKGEQLDLKTSVFGELEINLIKSTIIGIEHKDLLNDLKNGEICIGLKQNNDIVAYSFVRKKPFYIRKRYFNLVDKDIYAHSTYVFEKYRGKNIASYLNYQRFELLEKEGVLYHHSISEYFNKSAIRMQKKSNSKIVALYLSVILFRKFTMNFTLKKFKN
ncbi:MAG: hypothetical protein ACI8RP_000766 [Urechidicola sp.]|jgi:hypothetical protein